MKIFINNLFLEFITIFCHEKTDLPIVRFFGLTFGGQFNPLAGAVFKVITPSGEEITLDATDENGRAYSRSFSSAEVAQGKFQIVEVTAPSGYVALEEPVEVTVGKEGKIKTIKNEPITTDTVKGTYDLTENDDDDPDKDTVDVTEEDGSNGNDKSRKKGNDRDTSSPDTGDSSHPVMWLTLLMGSMLVLISTLIYIRKTCRCK